MVGVLGILLSACSSPAGLFGPSKTPSPAATFTASSTFTPLPSPTLTLTPTPRTPPDLPLPYRNNDLTPYGTPHTYIRDACQYLHDKWSSTNSPPGTVILAIMFHSVTNKPITSSDQISEYDFRLLMNALHDNGFQAITMTQAADFMETNAPIPPRAVLLVVDDRKNPIYYDLLFRQYWEEWGWPVVNAWVSAFGGSDPYIGGNAELEAEGWVDHQAHGFQHMPQMGPNSDEAYIQQELGKPLDVFQEYFHKKPQAIIWPGGGFSVRTAEVARELGYRLGFTINPRGPLMFNWVPLADVDDPMRPSWYTEGPVGDPLMTLPRYWDTDAITHLDEVMQIGDESAAYAEQNRSTELEYYDILCKSTLGPLP
jgi:hypothetical protein